MEAEKIHRNKVARTIQQRRCGDGALDFADNRPAGILQAIAEPAQRSEVEDEALQGKFGNPVQREEDEGDLLQGKFEQPVQRVGEEDDESLQGKFERPVQREEDDDELVQGKILQAKIEVDKRYNRMQSKHGGGKAHGNRTSEPKSRRLRDAQSSKQKIRNRLVTKEPYKRMTPAQLKSENNTGLPDKLKAAIERLSGFSMDDVRVHYNSDKPSAVQALAYTQGKEIHVASGQERHLPHEAWHVAQQMAGRVKPTTEVGGLPVNDSIELEHEADVMGEKATRF